MTNRTIEEPVPESELKSALEGLLFVASGPIPIATLARITGWPPGKVRDSLQELADDLTDRGLNIQVTATAVQLTTDPQVAEIVRRFLGTHDPATLSRGALETLSIIAFKQPVPRSTIEVMRGVNSDYMLGRLRERGLVEEVGRAPVPGRPVLYGTTFGFLQHFGLSSVDELRLATLNNSNGDHSSSLGRPFDPASSAAAAALA